MPSAQEESLRTNQQNSWIVLILYLYLLCRDKSLFLSFSLPGLSGKKVAPLANHRLEFVKSQLAGFERVQPAAEQQQQQLQQQQAADGEIAVDEECGGNCPVYIKEYFILFLFSPIKS